MRTFTVVLPLPPRALNPHAKGHWAPKAKATQAARTTGMVAAMVATKSTKPKLEKAIVTMVYDTTPRIRGVDDGYRPRDVQNALAAVKAYVDGCKDAGLIVDDNSGVLAWDRIEIVQSGKPGVVLTFREALA